MNKPLALAWSWMVRIRREASALFNLPAATEATLAVAAALEFASVGGLETLAVSVAAVELAVAALGSVNPLVADAGLASGGIVLALATSFRNAGDNQDEQTGNGRDTHFDDSRCGCAVFA
ncbi:hypothetical protein BC939DRAFT_466073 [Gamsiella multidivaricata]|uniref:uncharacterized protein n=1 Tax=Gamsiella multidivaricata TaxID=101098 RepID=UPI00221F8EB8|nr:uncharacterized protein BC939DRAFT_466073 [Gamsiella multidivaricata]KAI7817413.1 hypothetical protein BC939DRAFT_466073 [Gamsiella multidivaricata]